MESLYSGMSVGFGFLLFCTVLAFTWILFQNYKKRLLYQTRSIDTFDPADFQSEKECRKQRIDIIWPVSVKTTNGVIKAETKDLSPSGAFIKCNKPLLSGDQFHLIIETPSKGVILLKSEVIWSNVNMPEDKIVVRGMGIRFIKNRVEDIASLRSALEESLEYLDGSSGRASFQRIAFI